MKINVFTFLILGLSLFFISTQEASARPGTLDTKFGKKGESYMIGDPSTGTINNGVPYELNDGTLLIVGEEFGADARPRATKIILKKFLKPGVVDPSFLSTIPQPVFPAPFKSWFTRDCLVQSDGRIILIGEMSKHFDMDPAPSWGSSKIQIGLIAYFPNGDLDYSFGDQGVVSFELPTDSNIASAGAIGTDDSITVLTFSRNDHNSSDDRLRLIRFDAKGQLEKSFGVDGQADFTNYILGGYSFAQRGLERLIKTQDGFLILGTMMDRLDEDFPEFIYILKVNLDGTVHKNFGQNGVVLIPSEPSSSKWESLRLLGSALQGDKILIFIIHETGRSSLFRLLPDGKLDSIFGNGGSLDPFEGIYKTCKGEDCDYGGSFSVQSDQKILLTGPEHETEIVRLLPNGDLDLEFGNLGPNGGIYLSFSNNVLHFRNILPLQSGKILLTANHFGTLFQLLNGDGD